jgi:hypothetical protein
MRSWPVAKELVESGNLHNPDSSKRFVSTAKQVIDVWRQLDPRYNRLVKLKTEAAAKQLRKEIKAETMQISFRNRGNLNSGIIPREILAMELRNIDAWAARYYAIYCEVWELQGNKKSAALVRTIYTHFLRKLIAVRKSSVAHEAQRSACARGRFDSIARLRIESFKRSADQLSWDWAGKLEIEALELEARARLERSENQASFVSRTGQPGMADTESAPHSAQPKGAMPKKPIENEETHAKTVLPGAMIYGEVTSAKVGETVTVSIDGPGGLATPLKAWKWPDEITLPSARIVGVSPYDKYVAWDGETYVFRHTQESVLADKRLMLIGPVKGPTADDDSALTMGKDRVVSTATLPQKVPKGRPASVAAATRRALLRKLSATGVKGEHYCKAVDTAKLSTPFEWQKRDGCPKSYLEAWNHPNLSQRKRFRQRISDEKYKAAR